MSREKRRKRIIEEYKIFENEEHTDVADNAKREQDFFACGSFRCGDQPGHIKIEGRGADEQEEKPGIVGEVKVIRSAQ